MNNAPGLKPCPFCGKPAQVAGSLFFTDAVIVKCDNGHSNGCLYADRDAAITAWNIRADTADELLEALRALRMCQGPTGQSQELDAAIAATDAAIARATNTTPTGAA